ncbi:unnamed protein product [Ceutorhynchus assimilis]|uniref:Uncharacterized protein n=1 Tax=Ceutorhynchus assimilis TaxID=467358 RepID=A0A9N9QDZ5_9CUCU|nr:unnamed protein product [Ceutorhynchus assimilis]
MWDFFTVQCEKSAIAGFGHMDSEHLSSQKMSQQIVESSSKNTSKISDSDADLIGENKNPSQEILSVSSAKISMDSSPKTCPRKKKKTVSAGATKRSLKLKGQAKKQPIKTRHMKIGNPKLSGSTTKENLSKRDLRTEKAPQKTIVKCLKSSLKNIPFTSKIRSQKRYLKSKSLEDDTLSSEEGSSEIVSSKKVLKSSEEIVSDDKALTPGNLTHLKSREHERKVRKTLEKAEKMYQETARTKESASTSKKKLTKKQSSKTINSNDVTPKKKSRRKYRNKKKNPETKSESETFPPEALVRKMRESEANLPKQSESFKKYGVEIPTVQEILASRKKFETYRALVDKAKIIPLLPNPFINSPKAPVKPPIKLLDCKHVSLEEINEQFIENKTTLLNIKNGTQYSEKHQHFHKTNSNMPPYNPSNLVFSYPQINCMANLIREEFDPEERHLRYTFGVLIPELCLLIFMHTHKMNKEETVKYLDERPIEESDTSSTVSMDLTPKTPTNNKSNTSKIRSRKRDSENKSSEDDSETPEEGSFKDITSKKVLKSSEIIDLDGCTHSLTSENIMHLKSVEHDNKTRRTPKKVRRMFQETDTSPPKAPTENPCVSKTTDKKHVSKTRKRRKKTA